MRQLDSYERLAAWVAPGGSLLVVGHLHTGESSHGHGHGGHGHGHGHGRQPETRDSEGHTSEQPPPEASVTAASITERFDPTVWEVVTADEPSRTVPRPDGSHNTLHDVVVRVVRR